MPSNSFADGGKKRALIVDDCTWLHDWGRKWLGAKKSTVPTPIGSFAGITYVKRVQTPQHLTNKTKP